jgi:hypothetical protein
LRQADVTFHLRDHPLLKKFAQCLGLSSLILVMNYGDLLGGGGDVRMHVPFPLVGIALAQLADIVILGLVLFAVLAPLKRSPKVYPWVRLALAILAPPYLFERMRQLIHYDVPDWLPVLVCVLWVVGLPLLLFKFNRWYRQLMRVGDAVGIFLFLFAVSSIAQLLFVMLWKPGPYRHDAAWETRSQPPRHHAKIVWVVFDELSFDQVFEHRAKNLSLPNFDALRAESTLFTDVQPVGSRTVKVLPSLLTGQGVDDTQFTFANKFKVHYTGVHGWHPLDGSGTIFADAQKQGWRTAVVGWYNPYCTLYAGAIDQCYFMNLDRIDGDMAQQNSFWRNTYAPLQQVVREIKAPARADKDSCNVDVRQRLKTDKDLEQHALELLHDDQADMVFFHMAVPHSPNIWSRIEDDYTTFCDSSYLDNLALADRILGKFMAELRASPRWADTTVIVEGDHSWRISLWDWLPAWTDEDDAASRSGFDPRPALVIHAPGQTKSATNATAWSLLNVHRVVEQALRGQPGGY